MKKTRLLWVVFCGIFILFGFSACSIGEVLPPKGTLPQDKQETPESRVTPAENSGINQQPTIPISPTSISFEQFKCTESSAVPLMNKGENLLFVDWSENSGRVLAVDDYAGRTHEVLKLKEVVLRFAISKDGKQLAFVYGSSSNPELVVYNLETGNHVALPFDDEKQAGLVTGWTEDGKILLHLNREDEFGSGISYQYLLVDPKTGGMETVEVRYDLPGYYRAEQGFSDGIVAIDRLEERALYERWDENEKSFVKKTLIDLKTNQFIWDDGEGYNGRPDWSSDGNHVIFGSLFGSDPYLKIMSLSRDGTVKELSDQPLATYEYMFRYFDFSPDDRYIHFTFWQSIGSGPGYVFDTKENEFWEICGYKGQFTQGEWLMQPSILVYQTQDGEDNQFWVLDTQNRETRKLISGKNITYIGFTPIKIGN